MMTDHRHYPSGRRPTADEEQLLREAAQAAGHAYAPYSGFAVGAVAVGVSGRRAVGVNVENASYPVAQCAERVALGSLVAAGERQLATVALAAADGGDLLPCGACLQALAEFGDPLVVACLDGRSVVFRLHQLLPAPFARCRLAADAAPDAGSAPAVDPEAGGGRAAVERPPERRLPDRSAAETKAGAGDRDAVGDVRGGLRRAGDGEDR